jgi:hypothetical protein
MRPEFKSRHHAVSQDITPYSERFAHIRGGYGARASIGRLDAEWRQQEQEQIEQRSGVMDMVRSVKRPKMFSGAYLQPLGEHGNKLLARLRAANLYVSYWSVRFRYGVLKPSWAKGKDSLAQLAAATRLYMGSVRATTHLSKFELFPKKYTADKGLMVDMDTPAMEVTRRVAAPLFGIVAMLILFALAWNPTVPFADVPAHPPKQGASAASGGSRPATTASNGQGSAAGAQSGGSTTQGGQSAPVTGYSSSTPLTAVGGSSSYSGSGTYSPIVGRAGDTSTSGTDGSTSPTAGSGGGGSVSSLPGIPGVTSPVTTTVPGTTVGSGDKTIISTSPITVTLN